MRRVFAAYLIVAVALALTAPPAAGTVKPRAAPVYTLDIADSTSRPDLVVDRFGTVTVVWSRDNNVVARSRINGVWQPRTRLGRGYSPSIGVGAAGSLTVIWLRHLHGFGPQVMVARHPVRTGEWTQSMALTPPAPAVTSSRGAYSPALSVGGGGNAVVSWLWNQEDSGAAVVQARYRPVGGPWESIATLSGSDARNPVAAIDGAGRATVAFAGARARPYAVTHGQRGWGKRVKLGTHGVNAPQIAAGAAGDVVVTFAASVDQRYEAQAVVRAPGEPWSDPVSLEAPPQTLGVLDPVVDVDGDGVATAAWWRSDDSVVVATHPRDGAWTEPEVIAPPGARVLPEQPYLDLAVSADGTAVLSWTRKAGGETTVGAAVRSAGTWTAVPAASAGDRHCAAGEGEVRAGVAVVVWRCDAVGGDVIEVTDLLP